MPFGWEKEILHVALSQGNLSQGSFSQFIKSVLGHFCLLQVIGLQDPGDSLQGHERSRKYRQIGTHT